MRWIISPLTLNYFCACVSDHVQKWLIIAVDHHEAHSIVLQLHTVIVEWLYWAYMDNCFTSRRVTVLWPRFLKKKKNPVNPPHPLHYLCPWPRTRTDIDLILRWKPLCTSAELRVSPSPIIRAIKGRTVGLLVPNMDRDLYTEENKEARLTFIFRLNISPPVSLSLSACEHGLGPNLATYFTFMVSCRHFFFLFSTNCPKSKLGFLPAWG